MSLSERITARFGRTRDREQYPDTDDYQDPQAVADPHTLEEETHESLLDRIEDNWLVYFSFSLLGLALLVLAAVYFGQYFVTVLANPWTQRIGAAATIFGCGLYLGIQRERAAVKEEQELTLYDPNGENEMTFRGEYRTADGAPYPIFIPFKGNRGLFGGSPEPYAVGDLSRSLVKAHGHDATAPARIRLHSDLASVMRTDRGLRVVQSTAGLVPDPQGQDANLEAELPETVDEQTVMEMTTLVRELEEELEQKEKQMDTLRRQRSQWKTLAKKNFKEFQEMMDKQGDLFTKFLPSNRRTESEQPRRDNRKSGSERALAAARNGEDD